MGIKRRERCRKTRQEPDSKKPTDSELKWDPCVEKDNLIVYKCLINAVPVHAKSHCRIHLPGI
jgi:hypothetical protein